MASPNHFEDKLGSDTHFDHYDDPHRHSLEERDHRPSRKSSSRRGLPGFVQQLRNAVMDSDEEAVQEEDEEAGGILLNQPAPEKANITTTTSRRRSVIAEEQDDTGSQVSMDHDDDVCLPVEEGSGGIDFEEIDDYVKQQRRGSNATRTGTAPNKEEEFSTDETDPRFNAHSDDVHLANLEPMRTRDSDRSRRRRSSVGGAGIPQMSRPSVFQDRFTFFTADSEATLRGQSMKSLLEVDPTRSTYKELFEGNSDTWWLDCYNPTDGEVKMLSKAFGVHPLTSEDIRTQESREKVEIFKSYYFVTFNTYEQDWESEDYLDPVPVYMLVFKEGIITVHFSPFQHFANVRRRIRQLREYVNVTPDWVCYAIIDDITDSFVPVSHEIEVETEVIEESVFDARDDDFSLMLRRIGKARSKTLTMMRLLSGKADVVRMFAKRCTEGLGEGAPKGHISLYLGDIQDHIVTMYQNLIAYEKILSRSHTNYLAQLQVQSVDANHRVTDTLGKVTVVGTILIPMNLVTGLFGMNVRVPGMEGTNLGWFFGILGFLLVVVLTGTLLARWWLKAMAKKISGNFRNVGTPSVRTMRRVETIRTTGFPNHREHNSDYSMV